MTTKPSTIVVCGIIGSGKTTLAGALAQNLNWLYIPEGLHAIEYLPDLFTDPKRWAFETQISFLSEKSIQIFHALKNGNNIVVDRSLYEDVEIFARQFHENGHIDDRSFETYSKLAKYFIEQLPKPDFAIFCKCSLPTVKERIAKRKRSIDILYPPNLLEEIQKRYDTWLDSYNQSSMYSIDSEAIDWRTSDSIGPLIEEIKEIILSEDTMSLLDAIPKNEIKFKKGILNRHRLHCS